MKKNREGELSRVDLSWVHVVNSFCRLRDLYEPHMEFFVLILFLLAGTQLKKSKIKKSLFVCLLFES